ncbi:MAG: DUF4258 domain-containing protein [Methylobacter sp.]|nr:DUF4258 domain-containing protein [Methylobacter sp.]
MLTLANIVSAIQTSQVRITDHADEEAEADNLTFDEIYYSVLHGEIIETYFSDKPYPSCLIYGKSFSAEPIHSVWAYNKNNQWGVLITVYRPNPERWINWKERKI